MKKLLLFVFIAVLAHHAAHSQSNTRYWVAFTDKNNSPYSISSPQQFLSQKAITRRVNHNYPITTEDFPVNPSYTQQVQATGAIITSSSRWFNGVVVRITDTSQLTAINNLGCVQNTRPLARVKTSQKNLPVAASAVSNEKNASSQSDRFDYGQSQGQIYLLNGECLHNQGYDGTGMQIAVIDEGFYKAPQITVFDSLWHNHQVISTHDFFINDTINYNNSVLGGHGMEVLSCMAAYTPGQMIGTAPYAQYYLLRSEIDSTEKIIEVYQWVSAIEYADSAGADVATSSLGYTEFNDASQNFTWADLNGRTAVASISATMAARRGMIVCIAAGNEGCNNSSGSSSQCWQKISVPADADSILAVGATDGSGNYAFFSSTGNTADGRIKPDVAAQGYGTTIAYTSNNIGSANGTSFATPTIAGMVACLWQGNPAKKNMEVIAAIKQSASKYNTPDSLLGYGIPDFCVADQILKGNFSIASYSNTGKLCASENCSVTVCVYDLSGRLLKKEILKGGSSSPDELAQKISFQASAGIYVVRMISSEGNTFSKKVVKYE